MFVSCLRPLRDRICTDKYFFIIKLSLAEKSSCYFTDYFNNGYCFSDNLSLTIVLRIQLCGLHTSTCLLFQKFVFIYCGAIRIQGMQ